MSHNPVSPVGNLAVLAALAACLSTALGGSAFVAIRFLVTETEPVTIAFLRNFVAAVVLTAIALLVVRRWPTPRELVVMGAMGALFFGGLQFIFSNALIYTTSSRGALAYTTAPFMTLLIAAAFGIEQPTRQKIIGIVIATLGVVVALGQSASAPPGAWIGDGLILVGALITAVYGVWSNRALKLIHRWWPWSPVSFPGRFCSISSPWPAVHPHSRRTCLPPDGPPWRFSASGPP